VSSKPLERADKHQQAVVKRVSRKHDDEGHGGAWKVAFADFCLALMCLFLVMWVMAAREQERIKEVMRAPGGNLMDEGRGHLADTMSEPHGSLIDRAVLPRTGGAAAAEAAANAGAAPQKARYESPAELEALSRALERLGDEAGLSANMQTVVTAYGLRVMLHDTDRQGMFVRGSSEPNDHFRRLLRHMGPLFARMSNQMLVVGHTDSVQYADRGFNAFTNWTLSSDRAMVARANLVAGGMPAASVLQVVGMADRAPLDSRDPEAAVNRRIELLILTNGQARSVASMFGLPGHADPLVDGVDSALPDRAALEALRARVAPQPAPAPTH